MSHLKPKFISIHYTVRDRQGKILDSSYDGEPMMYLEGKNQVMAGLENGLRGVQAGEKKVIHIHSSDAYGSRDEKLVITVPLTKLNPNGGSVKEGAQFKYNHNNEGPRVYRVTLVTGTHATLDANHPLAGQDLFFDVEVKAVRAATR